MPISSAPGFAGVGILTAFGPIVQLKWRAGDRPSTPTETRLSTPAMSTVLQTSTPSPHISGLSTGSKAAIGVVVPLAVLALAAAIVFTVLRRRRQRKAAPAEYPGKPELDATQNQKSDGTNLLELATSERLHEAGSNVQHELPVPYAVHELNGST